MAESDGRLKTDPVREHPPGTWAPARRLFRSALAPVERFLAVEAASGVVLLVVAAIALIWANSPWRESYQALWHTPLGVRLGPFSFERDLHFVINDGLMTIFFFVVGLEIRREMHRGELSDLRRAVLPVVAALGGMLVPAGIYLAANHGQESVRGWGTPMATDIAFAVGVLALLGKRVPPALRILLLALAVIDDVGAILVIALFYSTGFVTSGFVVMAVGVVGVFALRFLGVRSPWAYVPAGLVLWAGTYLAGIHPTLAGVVVGLLTPVQPWFGLNRFLEKTDASVAALRVQPADEPHGVLPHLDEINRARREAVSPVERIQHALHGVVAFGIMPAFALANAGVTVGEASLSGSGLWVFVGVFAGLVVGKPLGIFLLSYLAVRLRAAALPTGTSWPLVALVGLVGGIGFTMALFIAQLAFPKGVLLETAKLGILAGSGVAAAAGYALGRVLLPATGPTVGARSEAEAEASTTV